MCWLDTQFSYPLIDLVLFEIPRGTQNICVWLADTGPIKDLLEWQLEVWWDPLSHLKCQSTSWYAYLDKALGLHCLQWELNTWLTYTPLQLNPSCLIIWVEHISFSRPPTLYLPWNSKQNLVELKNNSQCFVVSVFIFSMGSILRAVPDFS